MGAVDEVSVEAARAALCVPMFPAVAVAPVAAPVAELAAAAAAAAAAADAADADADADAAAAAVDDCCCARLLE